MSFYSKTIPVRSSKQFELIDITDLVKSALHESGIKSGLVNVFSSHTTASVRLNHNESMLMQDIMRTMYGMVPIEANYTHDVFEMRETVAVDERSNGHAHVKAFLLGSSETLPVVDGQLQLGEKQSIFFVELDGGRERDFIFSAVGQ